MKLKVLLPFRIFLETGKVRRMVAETNQGFIGIWPHRLDFVAELVPGILTYEVEEKSGEVMVAVDEGIMVKAGDEVLVSVRSAVGGADLGHLQEVIRQEFLRADEQEVDTRSVLARLESGFVRRYSEFHRE